MVKVDFVVMNFILMGVLTVFFISAIYFEKYRNKKTKK